MKRAKQWFRINYVSRCVALAALLLMVAAPAIQAQTLTVLHTFTDRGDGYRPIAGLSIDAAGNLYGTAEFGIPFCCGTVYKVSRHGSGWVTLPIYTFTGPPDGAMPTARVIFGPDGSLYGTTMYGGTGSCISTANGCGTVFKLQPPLRACKSVLCPWRETILYSFASQNDGENPQSEITFDRAGNIYGTTWLGGTGPCNDGFYTGCGTVFKLTHNSDGSWSKSTLYNFQDGSDGGFPIAEVTLDQAGNLYGTASSEATLCNTGACGLIYELTQSGSGWTETVLHNFTGGADGNYPQGGLILDSSGNLYGAAAGGGMGSGTVYEMSPGQGGWSFSTLYSFSGLEAAGPASKLTMDGAGDLYGSSADGGIYTGGTVYKLTAANGAWTYSTLHSFNTPPDASDGFFLYGSVVLDPQGNIYGTASMGPYPDPDDGTVFEITP